MVSAMSVYNVTYERDGSGWWLTLVREVPGCHTQGRTIKEARRRIREALELFVDDAKTAQLVDHIALPEDVRGAVDGFHEAREELEAATVRSQQGLEAAPRALAVVLDLSVRDTGDILGLSHQRIQQIVASRRRARGKATPRKTKTIRGRTSEESQSNKC